MFSAILEIQSKTSRFWRKFGFYFVDQQNQRNRKSEDLSEFEANRKILGGDVKQKKTVEMPVRNIKMTE